MSKAIEKSVVAEEVKAEEKVNEKPYTLRELCDEDLYSLLAILGAVIPDDAKDAFAQIVTGEKTLQQVGGMVAFDMVRLIMKNFKTVKSEVYDFLSDLSSIPADKIRKMPFGTTPTMLKEVFEDAKNADFFKELSKLF